MIAHLCSVIVMSLFWIAQVLSKQQTGAFLIIALLLGFAPVIAEFYFWGKDTETPAIKHLCAIGFAIYFTFSLFTATNNQVLMFVIPMVLIISVYGDIRYSLMINMGTVLESILLVVIGNSTGRYGYDNIYSGIIQIIVMLILAMNSFFTSRTLNLNITARLRNVKEAQGKAEQLVENLSSISSHVNEEITAINQSVEQLNDAAIKTQHAMEEVSSGASDTANAVQTQAMQTQAIQERVSLVTDAARQIDDNMQHTIDIVTDGNASMDALVQLVDVSVSNSVSAAEKMEALNHYMDEMNSIVELIDSITSQTSLLALNASIEAARAGDAGKGFAVVADEITGMASRTKDATVQITDLISNVTSAIQETVTVIQQMIDGINEEKESVQTTAGSFSTIQKNSLSIQDNIKKLSESSSDLYTANEAIADTIQTISAVSEELTAHASETMDSEAANTDILNTIAQKMQALVEFINQK